MFDVIAEVCDITGSKIERTDEFRCDTIEAACAKYSDVKGVIDVSLYSRDRLVAFRKVRN